MYVAGNDSFVGDFIEYSGGVNVIGDGKSGIYSKEMVVSANPDIIIIATMGLAGEQEKKEWMRFDSIAAVQKRRIFIWDSTSVCSPSPLDLPSTIAEMAVLFFPDQKQKINDRLIDGTNEK
jgi:ABC-type Fe3+-hydroxamate transport system substrate-binding protein